LEIVKLDQKYDDSVLSHSLQITRNIARAVKPYNVFVAGGAALNIYSGDTSVRDIDLFCLSHPLLSLSEQEASVVSVLETFGYNLQSTSETGLVSNFVNNINHGNPDYPLVQLICLEYNKVTDLFNAFDIYLSQILYDGDTLYHTHEFTISFETKIITLNNLSRPHNTALRLCKFHSRGYDVNRAMGKLLYTVKSDPNITVDTLGGYCEPLVVVDTPVLAEELF
jgi:hypothetical protein